MVVCLVDGIDLTGPISGEDVLLLGKDKVVTGDLDVDRRRKERSTATTAMTETLDKIICLPLV